VHGENAPREIRFPAPTWRNDLPILAAVAAVALVGRLPALGGWWTLDDWGLLARAAGLEGAESAVPVRWLSQHLWWSVTWPLFGLNAGAHAVLRLLMHIVSSLLVVRLGARGGLGATGRLLAGLLFAATPLAFTPLYWAAAVQESLATVLALAAVLLWTRGGRRPMLAATLCATGSILSKESALGLPLLFAGLILLGIAPRVRAERPVAWVMVLLLAMIAVFEARLVMEHFATGGSDPYRLGGPLTALGNLTVYGWWLMTPGPILASHINGAMGAAGGAVFALWTLVGILTWRRGGRLPAIALVAALLALAPTLLLKAQIKPYMALLAAAAGALTLGSLLPARLALRPAILMAAALVTVIWSFAGMRMRLGNRNEMGFPADPVVRATALSWQVATLLDGLRWPDDDPAPRDVVLYQQQVTGEAVRRAEALGERMVTETELVAAVGGSMGPNLMMSREARIAWATGLITAPENALVLCEDGTGFKMWGKTGNALLYAALSDIGLGHFPRARRHLVRAAALNDDTVSFLYDEGQMVVPMAMVLERKEAFVDWTVSLLSDGATLHEVGGLQDLFYNLLTSASGRSREDLTAGSRVLRQRPAGADSASTIK